MYMKRETLQLSSLHCNARQQMFFVQIFIVQIFIENAAFSAIISTPIKPDHKT